MILKKAGHACGLLALALSSATGARAQLPDGITIRWKTDSECTRPLDLEWQITRLITPQLALREPIVFDVRVDALARGRHALSMQATRESGRLERTVELPTCSEAQDAVAVLVAITIDPTAAQRAKTVGEPTPPPRDVPPPRPVAADRRARPRPGFALGAGLLGDLQALPDASFGPWLAAELALAGFRISLGGHYLLARTAKAEAPGVEARVELMAGALTGSYLHRIGPFSLGPHAVAEIGYLRATGIGAEAGRTEGVRWIAAYGGGRFDYAVRRRAVLRFDLLVGFPFATPRVALNDEQAFYTTRSVTARVELGVLIRLGSPP